MTDNLELKNLLSDRLVSKFGDFEKEWQDLIKGLGIPLVEYIIAGFKKENYFINELQPGAISIVIDNNFIFGQIKGAIHKEKKFEDTFIYKLTQLSFIKILAPYKLQEELYSKIESVLEKGSEEARLFANTLLEKISIQDALWTNEWKRANNLIGDNEQKGDADDVPYLALAFDTKPHAIVSMDKVFNKQGDVQIWNIPQIDKVMTNYYKGTFSLLLVGGSIYIIHAIIKILFMFFKMLHSFILSIFEIVMFLIANGINAISKISPIIPIALGGIFFVLYTKNENFKSFIDDLLKMGKDKLYSFLEQIAESLYELNHFIKEFIYENKAPFVTSFEVLGFLFLEYQELVKMMEELDKKRPK